MTQAAALFVAALLTFTVGLIHSVLGERFILMRLPEQAIFKARILRFAWHLTTIAWWGVGAMLVLASRGLLTAGNTLRVIAATMAVTSAIILVSSRGRHLAWPVFLAIAILSFWAAD
jgi:hypothetical protein